MAELWNEVKSHKLSAILYSVYFVIALAAHAIKEGPDINGLAAPLIVAIPLFAGALVAWWKLKDAHILRRKTGKAIVGGMLAGILSSELCFVAMKGGMINELIDWLRGGEFRGAEVLEFLVFFAIVGSILGLFGSVSMRLTEGRHPHARQLQ